MKIVILLFILSVHIIRAHGQTLTGILGAFPPELVLLRQQMKNRQDTTISGIPFHIGTLEGKQIVLAQTGVGKVNAAITTTLMLTHFKPSRILFSGIAGGVDPKLLPGDLVVATKVAYHDFGMITDDGMTQWATKNPATMVENPRYFICDPVLVEKAIARGSKLNLETVQRAKVSSRPAIKSAVIVTGDVFVSSEALTKRLVNELGASATEMEGAAVAQACYQQNVPFLIIRSLSDNANSKAKADMDTFYKVAAANAAMLVMAMLAD